MVKCSAGGFYNTAVSLRELRVVGTVPYLTRQKDIVYTGTVHIAVI